MSHMISMSHMMINDKYVSHDEYVSHDKHVSHDELNTDLNKISYWVLQWRMKFNPDQNKQAQKVHF